MKLVSVFLILALGFSFNEFANADDVTPHPGSSVGLRNFRALSAHYSTATGVPESHSNVRTVFDQVASSLPPDANVSFFSSQSVRSSSALAAAYCYEFLAREATLSAERRVAHKSVDFTKGPNAVSPSILAEVLGVYSSRFWGREMTASESQAMSRLSDDLLKGFGGNPTHTRRYLAAMCTAFGSALDSLVIASRK